MTIIVAHLPTTSLLLRLECRVSYYQRLLDASVIVIEISPSRQQSRRRFFSLYASASTSFGGSGSARPRPPLQALYQKLVRFARFRLVSPAGRPPVAPPGFHQRDFWVFLPHLQLIQLTCRLSTGILGSFSTFLICLIRRFHQRLTPHPPTLF